MINLWHIVLANNATFYNYASNRRVAVAPRLCVFLVIALMCATILDFELKDFLNGVIPVQAILIGFSFSVMFFLVSSPTHPGAAPRSIEEGQRSSRLATLSKELFHNLAYFNLTAMACLVAALLLLIPNPFNQIRDWLLALPPNGQKAAESAYTIVWSGGAYLIRSALAFLVLESGFTFARTVGRVNYLFEQKLKASADDVPQSK